MAYDLYDTFVTELGNNDAIQSIRHIWLSCCIANGFLGFIVQVLYAYRVKILSTSRFWSLGITLLSFIQLAGAITAGIGGKNIGRLDVASVTESTGYIMFKLGGASCDVLITILMTYYLLRMKKHTHRIEDVITKIVRLVVGAGALTSLFAVIDVILYFADAKNGSSWAFRLIIGKLYTNSMMVVFNSRFSIRNNHYNYDAEPTWRSSFFVTTDRVITQEADTHVSFNGLSRVNSASPDHRVGLKLDSRIKV